MEKGQAVFDVFGGTGGVARASQRLGFPGRVWDLVLGSDFDMGRRVVVERLLRCMRRGEAVGLMLATPCTSLFRKLEMSRM